jgi:hypothetical protein
MKKLKGKGYNNIKSLKLQGAIIQIMQTPKRGQKIKKKKKRRLDLAHLGYGM